MAYTVALQTHELGVRMALGAQQGNVLRIILWKGFRLISAGTVIGVWVSLGLTRFLSNQIPGVSATDPWTFCAVVILLLAVGLLASYLPARRAAQVDPLAALHYE
jgi:putative ABC transport system permease protein